MTGMIYELLLTRIFSVVMWHHFASLAIALAMLGLTLGSLAVAFSPGLRGEKAVPALLMGLSGSLSGVFLLLALAAGHPAITHRFLAPFYQSYNQPFVRTTEAIDGGLLLSLGILFAILAVPFIFIGAVQAFLFRDHGKETPRLYLADLSAAAAGGLLFIPAIGLLGAPRGLVLVSFLAATGALVAAPRRRVAVPALLLLLLALWGLAAGPVSIPFARGRYQPGLLMEEWNAFSRVAAYPRLPDEGAGSWGMSRLWTDPLPQQVSLLIDDNGYTTITRYDGNPATLDYLKADVVALGHSLFTTGETLVIGPGGGRDILASLAFGHTPVTGVEINPLVVKAVKRNFREFAGGLDTLPGVTLEVDEGRSYLARSGRSYRLIQATLLWDQMSSAAGAFTMTESNLYTMEAFGTYLDHLAPGGVLSFSRFIHEPHMLRLVVLAKAALRARGAADPTAHLFAASERGMATLLIARDPLTAEQVATLTQTCRRWGFALLLAPGSANTSLMAQVAAAPSPGSFEKEFGIDLSPPTDSRPFFHYLTPPGAFFLPGGKGKVVIDKAVVILRLATLLVTGAALLLLLLPRLAPATRSHRPPWPVLAYAAACGVGYMLIEIHLIKSLTLFLGLPVYSLVVTTVGLLTFSSLGAGWSGRSKADPRAMVRAAITVLAVAAATFLLQGPFSTLLFPLPLAARLGLALLFIAPLGFVMGLPYPLLLARCAADDSRRIPWVWAVNGAFSVAGAMLALVVAMNAGFTAVALGGLASYAIVLATARTLRRPAPGG
jgi:spermidine synthase